MQLRMQRIALLAAVCAAPAALDAQFDFKVDGRDVQFHSFGGSFPMTDGVIHASVALTDKFRVGPLCRAGSLSYTAYGGVQENDPFGGTHCGDVGEYVRRVQRCAV